MGQHLFVPDEARHTTDSMPILFLSVFIFSFNQQKKKSLENDTHTDT